MTLLIACFFLLLGVFFLLRDTTPGYVYGIITLGNGVNLLIFAVGGVKESGFPFIGRTGDLADPLPQALVLTAIVISFATLCFVLALLKKINILEKGES